MFFYTILFGDHTLQQQRRQRQHHMNAHLQHRTYIFFFRNFNTHTHRAQIIAHLMRSRDTIQKLTRTHKQLRLNPSDRHIVHCAYARACIHNIYLIDDNLTNLKFSHLRETQRHSCVQPIFVLFFTYYIHAFYTYILILKKRIYIVKPVT